MGKAIEAEPLFTALVMAASRSGAEDRVAKARGMVHKSLVPVAGKEMLARIVDALKQSSTIGRIYVSLENEKLLEHSPLLAEQYGRGDFVVVPSKGNLATSVVHAIDQIEDPFPLLITTSDNALHVPEIVETFCRDAASRDCDAVLAVTPAEVVLNKYPEGQRAFHRLRDGAYSGCNMYALLTPAGAKGARAFATGGQFAKNPVRLIGAVGLISFLLYKLRWLPLDQVMRRISRALGMKVEAGIVPFAEGPIDVDNEKDLELAERILAQREAH